MLTSFVNSPLQRKSFKPWTPDSQGRWLPCVEKNVPGPPPALLCSPWAASAAVDVVTAGHHSVVCAATAGCRHLYTSHIMYNCTLQNHVFAEPKWLLHKHNGAYDINSQCKKCCRYFSIEDIYVCIVSCHVSLTVKFLKSTLHHSYWTAVRTTMTQTIMLRMMQTTSTRPLSTSCSTPALVSCEHATCDATLPYWLPFFVNSSQIRNFVTILKANLNLLCW